MLAALPDELLDLVAARLRDDPWAAAAASAACAALRRAVLRTRASLPGVDAPIWAGPVDDGAGGDARRAPRAPDELLRVRPRGARVLGTMDAGRALVVAPEAEPGRIEVLLSDGARSHWCGAYPGEFEAREWRGAIEIAHRVCVAPAELGFAGRVFYATNPPDRGYAHAERPSLIAAPGYSPALVRPVAGDCLELEAHLEGSGALPAGGAAVVDLLPPEATGAPPSAPATLVYLASARCERGGGARDGVLLGAAVVDVEAALGGGELARCVRYAAAGPARAGDARASVGEDGAVRVEWGGGRVDFPPAAPGAGPAPRRPRYAVRPCGDGAEAAILRAL